MVAVREATKLEIANHNLAGQVLTLIVATGILIFTQKKWKEVLTKLSSKFLAILSLYLKKSAMRLKQQALPISWVSACQLKLALKDVLPLLVVQMSSML